MLVIDPRYRYLVVGVGVFCPKVIARSRLYIEETMNIKSEHHPAIAIPPIVMPIMGLAFGLLAWVADAVIDVYVLDEEQELLVNILLPDESTELWMRTLVVIVFLFMGFISRHILLKHIELDRVLLEYQKKLEQMVEQRTHELLSKTEQLEVLASTDPLTGLSNRRKFNGLLDHEIKRFERYEQSLCLILIDIDHFKTINDTYGHDVGDKVIVEMANVLETGVRRSDCVARWGGEEFILLNIELDEKQAYKVAEKLRALINKTSFETVGKITVSIGVTQIKPKDDAELILKRVDRALYAAKNNGRDCVVSFADVEKAA